MNLRISILCLFVAYWNIAFANQIPTLSLSDLKSSFPAEKFIGTYVDESQFLSIKQLYGRDADSLFKVNGGKQLNFGYTSAAIWCQLRLINNTDIQWYLKVGHPLVDHLDIYLVNSAGIIVDTIKSGSLCQSNKVTYSLSGFLFKLPLITKQEYRIFLRMESRNILIPMIEIGSKDYFYRKELPEVFLSGGFYGLLFGLIVYTVFVYFFKRVNYAIFCCLYLINFGLLDLLLNGYLVNYLENIHKDFLNYWVLLVLCSLQLSLVYFTNSFLESRYLTKFDRQIFKLPLYGFLLLLSICWWIDFTLLIGFAWFLGFVFPLAISVYLSSKSAIAGYLPARIIVAGHISLIIGLVIFLLSVSGFLEYSKLITHISHVAIGMQAVLFGLAFYTKQNWSASNQSAARLEVIKKIRENQSLQSELSKQQKQLYNAVLHAQENERARIAKDLHDGVGQTLAAVKMISSQLIFSNPELKNNIAATNSMELLDNACNEVRQISHQMMPHNLIKFGLKSGLEELFEKTFQGSNIVLEYQFTNLKSRYSQSVEIGIYRIVQEIISNMIKHSACKKAFIDIIENKDHLIIIAEDDGKGFDYNENTSLGAGLGNIKFRVHALSASLIIETKPQNGCVYRINIPLIKN